MKTDWFKGIADEQEIDKIKSSVKSSRLVLERLSNLMEEKIKELDAIHANDYDSPSWAAKQAHINGLKEAYRKVIALCKIN